MRRRWWFLRLFAPQVVGQQATGIIMESVTNCMYGQDGRLVNSGCESKSRGPDGKWVQRPVAPHIAVKLKPANNECPVCGTIAKPYLREYEVLKFKSQGLIFTVDEITKTDLTRCAHCSAAFWQDAGGGE